ncbi:MAG: HYR domain-containing protein, partial [Blastocatellia bacterium]
MKHSIKRILFVMGSILSLAGLMSWSMLRIPGGGSWVVHAVAVTPEPAGSVGINPGHRVEFRKTTGAFLTNVTDADALFAGGIPSAFSSFDNGVAVINYSDFATNPSPPQQQNFGNDRDIRSASPNGFGAGGQNDYAMHSAGYILIPQAGSWNFTVNSDDGFRLRIGATDAVVTTFPTPKIPSNVTGVAEVPVAGLYRYDLVYYEHDGDSEVEFFANGPGQPNNFLVGDPGGSLRVFQDIQGPTPCTLTCAPNKTQSKDSNQCGAIVTYAAPSTTGTCGTVVCTPASGSFFPVGTTTVTCSSNTNPPATCSFTVTVTDTDTGPLTITCPGTITGVGRASCPLSSGNANFTVTTTG